MLHFYLVQKLCVKVLIQNFANKCANYLIYIYIFYYFTIIIYILFSSKVVC